MPPPVENRAKIHQTAEPKQLASRKVAKKSPRNGQEQPVSSQKQPFFTKNHPFSPQNSRFSLLHFFTVSLTTHN
jgi:hypothetical protein